MRPGMLPSQSTWVISRVIAKVGRTKPRSTRMRGAKPPRGVCTYCNKFRIPTPAGTGPSTGASHLLFMDGSLPGGAFLNHAMHLAFVAMYVTHQPIVCKQFRIRLTSESFSPRGNAGFGPRAARHGTRTVRSRLGKGALERGECFRSSDLSEVSDFFIGQLEIRIMSWDDG